MYAVIQTGGKQYRVEPGDVIDIERPGTELEDGAAMVFDRVLLVGGDGDPLVGDPLVAGAHVDAVCLSEVRGPKLRVFKMKRRKGYRRHRGHRQDLLRVRIGDIHQSAEADTSDRETSDRETSDRGTPKAASAKADASDRETSDRETSDRGEE
jgi:large subunit ribosomal protein L21